MYNRNRQRVRRVKRNGSIRWRDDVGGSGNVPFSFDNLISSVENISDWVGDANRRSVKAVAHQLLDVRDHGRPLLGYNPGGYREEYPRDPHPAYTDTNVDHLLALRPTIPLSLTLDFIDEAFDAFSDQVPQEVSIPNFLYELRDVAALVPKIDRDLGRTVNGGYLNYQFGWKPMVGDLKKLGSLIDTVRKRIDYLKATWNRETRLSHSKSFTGPDIGYPVWVPHPTSGGSGFVKIQGTWRAGGYLYHRLQGLDGLEGVLRGASAALGLNNPLGVIWEAIPYSFVADWFSNLGNVASRYGKLQPFTGVWSISRLSHSVSIEYRHETWLGAFPYGATSPSVSTISWEFTGRDYWRGPGLPVSGARLSASGFGTKQQMLAAALLSVSGK